MTRFPTRIKHLSLLTTLALSIMGSAQAFTLSSPQILSRQGDPLRVELDVIEMTVEEQLDFSANLAKSDIYSRAGIEYPSNNGSTLNFQIGMLRRSNGKSYIQIVTKEPVTVNFLDLMVDFRWSNGRSLRNIAVTLNDSRANTESSKPMPVATTETPTESKQTASVPAPVAQTPPPPKPVNETSSAPVESKKTTTSQTASQRHSHKDKEIKVESGDTAGDIAAQHLSDNISLEQMLVAMLRNNPEAFVDNNVNRLKAGSLLSIPTEQEVQQISQAQARKELHIQAKNFNAYRAELAQHAAAGRIPQASRDSQGKLEAQMQKPQTNGEKDSLKLTKPSGKSDKETKVAEALQAKEVASRAAEISRNIAELSKIAAATAASEATASGAVTVNVPPASANDTASNSQAQASEEESSIFSDDTTTLMAVGGFVLLAAIALWIRRRKGQKQQISGLPPVDVKFNIDLPSTAPEDKMTEHSVGQEHQTFGDDQHALADSTALNAIAASRPQQPSTPPIRNLPDISLDLDDKNPDADHFQVRIDLANELWDLGQQHTGRALMEEVAHEATGDIKAYAQKWLAERG